MNFNLKLKGFQRREQRVSGMLEVVRNKKKIIILGSINGSTTQKSFYLFPKNLGVLKVHIILIFSTWLLFMIPPSQLRYGIMEIHCEIHITYS